MVTSTYDLIVVTGCSFSCGMEMYDDQLPDYNNKAQRRASIWKWYKTTQNSAHLDIKQLNDEALEKWQEKERQGSWPALLGTLSGLPVINLSDIGASVGESLVKYSNFITNKPNKKILAVHQLPGIGRMFMRFDDRSRVRMLPGENELGYDKKYFAKNISKVKEEYRSRLSKKNYVEKHFTRIVHRLHRLSNTNGIDDFYIGNGTKVTGIPSKRFLIEDLYNLIKTFKCGIQGHPIDPGFNKYICEKITSIL